MKQKQTRNTPKLTFHGAAGTVTGSRYLLTSRNLRVLVDCGLFQGQRDLRSRNWLPFPEAAENIDAVFLTHAHLDHSGYLPALVKQGFKGPIHCTPATFDLCKILLLDAAKLQEEEAAFHNQHGTSRHEPALPLFTTEDAERALAQFSPVRDGRVELGEISVEFHSNGHILGSSCLDVQVEGRHILFSGDLGRPHDLIMRPPEPPPYADYVVVESTYGDRLHDQRDLKANLADCVNETIRRGGQILIPAFAVGRAQAVLYLLHLLQQQRLISRIPIYLDSPMAISATELMIKYHELHRLTPQQCRAMEGNVHYLRSVEQSMALNQMDAPSIIVSASGMATGGRVLYHLKRLLPDERNTIVLAGYQASGTRGHRLLRGEEQIKIHGHYYPVRARIENFDFLSAHADRDELLRWLRKLPVAPKQCFVTHGEPTSAAAFAETIRETLGWPAEVGTMGASIEL